MRYRLRERVSAVTLHEADIVGALNEAGLRAGDPVFFQSAMSSFGEIVGGSATVIGALDEVVGSDALVAMPAFPTVGTNVDYLSSNPVFDVRRTPSTMGAVTERFRQQQEVVRSLHPTHSVAARGLGAEALIAGHEDAPTPFGAGTPFARLIECNAWQVWFGCGIGAFTMYHAFECLRDDFAIPVFAEQVFSVRCVGPDGSERVVRTLVHDPAVSAHRIDANPALAARWRSLLLDSGILTSVQLGRGEILAVRLEPLTDELERLLGEGITIYDIPLSPSGGRG